MGVERCSLPLSLVKQVMDQGLEMQTKKGTSFKGISANQRTTMRRE